MIAKTATNPLERLKMLSQTGEHGARVEPSPPSSSSARQIYRSILRNEGPRGLWAGNGANLLRVAPAKAVVFASNDYYQSFLRNLFRIDERAALPTHMAFLAGGLSGTTATAVTYPLDFARGRISGKLASPEGIKHYDGIVRTMMRTVREEGSKALYRGVAPTLLGAMPYEGIKFGTVGALERMFPPPPPPRVDDGDDGGGNAKPSVWRKVVFGGLGGAAAGLITYPNDTVRRLLQLQGSRGTTAVYRGYWDCARKIYAEHGVRRFYLGATINVVRMGPNAAVQFGSYEALKRLTEKWF